MKKHNKKLGKISNKQFSLLKKRLRKNKFAEFKVKGNSMQPFLEPKDRVIVESCKIKDLKKGDIIIFRNSKNKQFVIHRVLWTDKRKICTKGDNCPNNDRVIHVKDLIGRVIKVKNKKISLVGKRIELKNRLISFVSSGEGLFFRYYFPVIKRLKAVKTKLIGDKDLGVDRGVRWVE